MTMTSVVLPIARAIQSHGRPEVQTGLSGSDRQALVDAMAHGVSTQDGPSASRLHGGSALRVETREFVQQMLDENPGVERFYLDQLKVGPQGQAAKQVLDRFDWPQRYLAANLRVPGLDAAGGTAQEMGMPRGERALPGIQSKPMPDKPLPTHSSQADEVLARFRHVYGNGSLAHVGTTIGGKVQFNIEEGFFPNGCALRMSHALHGVPGINMPQANLPGKTVSGSDGKPYFFRLTDLVPYLLSNKSGLPQAIEIKDKAQLEALQSKGIVYIEEESFSDATGHITLWDGKGFSDKSEAYFRNAEKILFIPLSAEKSRDPLAEWKARLAASPYSQFVPQALAVLHKDRGTGTGYGPRLQAWRGAFERPTAGSAEAQVTKDMTEDFLRLHQNNPALLDQLVANAPAYFPGTKALIQRQEQAAGQAAKAWKAALTQPVADRLMPGLAFMHQLHQAYLQRNGADAAMNFGQKLDQALRHQGVNSALKASITDMQTLFRDHPEVFLQVVRNPQAYFSTGVQPFIDEYRKKFAPAGA